MTVNLTQLNPCFHSNQFQQPTCIHARTNFSLDIFDLKAPIGYNISVLDKKNLD